jgi:hypothetical protein
VRVEYTARERALRTHRALLDALDRMRYAYEDVLSYSLLNDGKLSDQLRSAIEEGSPDIGEYLDRVEDTMLEHGQIYCQPKELKRG